MLKQFFSFLIISLALASCDKDPCKDVDCGNGTCDSGNCICDSGYEGLNCELEQRQAFVADYNVDETCNLGNFNYVISLTGDSEVGAELTIANIGDFGFEVIAIVNGTSFTITDQMVNGAAINGSGILLNGVLSLDYTMETTGGQILSCTMSCTPI
jgi:hypothetical protein